MLNGTPDNAPARRTSAQTVGTVEIQVTPRPRPTIASAAPATNQRTFISPFSLGVSVARALPPIADGPSPTSKAGQDRFQTSRKPESPSRSAMQLPKA